MGSLSGELCPWGAASLQEGNRGSHKGVRCSWNLLFREIPGWYFCGEEGRVCLTTSRRLFPGRGGPRPRLRFPSEHRASYSWLQFSRPSRSHVLNFVTLIIPYWETLYGRAVRKFGF